MMKQLSKAISSIPPKMDITSSAMPNCLAVRESGTPRRYHCYQDTMVRVAPRKIVLYSCRIAYYWWLSHPCCI